jgi:hypothetical protein
MMAKRVYFAFHYQDVIDFRANVVRKHDFTKSGEVAGYYDHSIWEKSKKEGTLALKRMINSELKGSTVTAVLIGSETYARRWVRYEIMKSVEKGSLVLGVHINSIGDKNKLTKRQGPNPFAYQGLQISSDGMKGRPTEWDGQKWIYDSDFEVINLTQQPLANRDKNLQLLHWFRTYDWIGDRGYDNFATWIQ